jgi:hypothetical protein
VQTFAPEGPLVVDIDETLERRRGRKIAAKGVSRPPALNPRALRQDQRPQMDLRGALGGGYVGFSGLGSAVSVGVGLLRTLHQRALGKRHKKRTEWAWQLLLLVRRWYPEREIVAVADRTYASLKLLDR